MSPLSLYLVVIALCLTRVSACQCPDGWTTFGQSCYFHGHDPLTFIEADRFCQHRHAHLIHINDATENAFVKSFLGELKDGKHWIGMTDQDIEGVWQWYDTDTRATFINWGRGQPEQGRAANCAAIWETFAYDFVDEPCTNRFLPFCEKECSEEVIIG